jgi:hypothetical protein
MSIIDFEDEERRRRAVEYPKLRLLQGGKEPPSSYTGYWLKDLEEHAVFIAREKKSPARWIASEYHVIFKAGDAIKVALRQWDPEKGRERIHYSWIAGPEFCQDWECIEILDDGKSYRTNNEDGLGTDEVSEGSDGVDKQTGPEVLRRDSND